MSNRLFWMINPTTLIYRYFIFRNINKAIKTDVETKLNVPAGNWIEIRLRLCYLLYEIDLHTKLKVCTLYLPIYHRAHMMGHQR